MRLKNISVVAFTDLFWITNKICPECLCYASCQNDRCIAFLVQGIGVTF